MGENSPPSHQQGKPWLIDLRPLSLPNLRVWHAGLYQKLKVAVDGNGKSLQEQSLYMKINTGQKTRLVSFDQFNYTVAVYVKMDGSVRYWG